MQDRLGELILAKKWTFLVSFRVKNNVLTKTLALVPIFPHCSFFGIWWLLPPMTPKNDPNFLEEMKVTFDLGH